VPVEIGACGLRMSAGPENLGAREVSRPAGACEQR